MFIDKKFFIQWIEKELEAKPYIGKPGEYIANCPFCDAKENHQDFTINVDKGVLNCWRGFDPRCESGMSILSFVSLYYDIPFGKAWKFVRKHFQGEDSLERVKKRLKNINDDRILNIKEEKIIWRLPKEATPLLTTDTEDANKALKWLLNTRRIPIEFIEELNPYYLGSDTHWKWKKYRNRVFFSVTSDGNRAWIAYSTRKKSTKKRPKTMNPPGRVLSSMLYLYDYYTDDDRPIILNEGIFDSKRLFMFDFNAVCGFGTSVSEEQISLLNKLPAKEVVVCYDPDANKFQKSKNGKNTCKSYAVAKMLRKYYFNAVSVMRLSREDPDRSRYSEVKKAYKNRIKFGNRLDRIKRMVAKHRGG